MTTDNAWLVVLAIVLVVLAGVLASIEAALTAFSKVRADELVRSGRRRAPGLRRLLDDPAPYLSTALFVRTACEMSAAALVTVVCLSLLPTTLGVVVAAGVMLVVSYVVLGVGPRTLGRQHADSVALAGSGFIRAMTRVVGPIARLLIIVGNAITPGKGFPEGPFGSEAELRELVDLAEASRLIESGERQMIHSVFELGDTLSREVMVPRTDMVFLEQTKTLRQFMSLALRSGFSRIPVVGDGEDDVVGVAYLKDVVRRVYEYHESETAERIDSVMRPAVFVPDSKPVDELLAEMQARRVHLVVVVDEYGGTAGLVTIEDVLEEIVGEITDEYDTEQPSFERLPDGQLRVNARLPIEHLSELSGVAIDDEDVDSVGGLLAKHLGRVPIPGSSVVVEGLRLTAERVEGRRNRLESVLVEPVDAREPASSS
ncbi:MAG: hemolysin family protein [Actinomycetota bacterium]|nr:hemolysin family protein [Actinomycetota bacterium]